MKRPVRRVIGPAIKALNELYEGIPLLARRGVDVDIVVEARLERVKCEGRMEMAGFVKNGTVSYYRSRSK